jgi:hypothetical protein
MGSVFDFAEVNPSVFKVNLYTVQGIDIVIGKGFFHIAEELAGICTEFLNQSFCLIIS